MLKCVSRVRDLKPRTNLRIDFLGFPTIFPTSRAVENRAVNRSELYSNINCVTHIGPLSGRDLFLTFGRNNVSIIIIINKYYGAYMTHLVTSISELRPVLT